MRMRRQMSEGRPGGNVRKKKKDNLNNRMALVGVTMVVLSLAVAVHIKGIDLKEKDRSYSIREENLEAQVAKEEERAQAVESELDLQHIIECLEYGTRGSSVHR